VSVATQTALAVARALIIAAVALVASGPLLDAVKSVRERVRTMVWALLLAPFLMPPLLISYAYSRFALGLVASSWRHEMLYAGVLLLKLTPLAVIVRRLVPSPLSAKARHCHRLFATPTICARVLFRMRGAGPAPWIAGALVFLFAFADFELASLWNMRTWTVAIFDAQTGGLALRETLLLVALPAAIQIIVLALLVTRRPRFTPAVTDDVPRRIRASFVYLALAACFVSLLPLVFVAAQAAKGMRTVIENFVLGREILASLLFALGAATVAAIAARGMGRWRILCGVGLPGALVISLVLLTLFQLPGLRLAYDTPVPLLLALSVVLLPAAGLLAHLLDSQENSSARHIARQIASRRLAWELDVQPRLAAFGVLFFAGYSDFTASSILAPIRLTPAFVRLHNLAHYGQTAVLSAMLLVAVATPLLLLLLTAAAGRLYARRHGC
jgi:ABC-type Fe3+ transport system permease subunit